MGNIISSRHRQSSLQLHDRRRSHLRRSLRSDKLQRHQRLTNIDLLKRSAPSQATDGRLYQQLYIEQSGKAIAFPAERVVSLAIVWLENYQGYQLFSWQLRSPISSILFETFNYCYESAVELNQRFDIEVLLELQPFGSLEKIDELILMHKLREQVALA